MVIIFLGINLIKCYVKYISSLKLKAMLKVNEIFGPTLQGEGKSTGKEVIFLRLSFCNLKCVWCDTQYAHNWVNTPYSYKDEVHPMSIKQVLDKILELDSKTSCKAVVISGGEPTIQHRELLPLILKLKKLGFWVEIETNGTILPTDEFLEAIDQINCSPKLANSKNILQLRRNGKVLSLYAQNDKVYFKFVVGSQKDLSEIKSLVKLFKMRKEFIYLMPLGKTKDELLKTQKLTKELAEELGFMYADRLHITLLGGGRGI